MNIVRRSCLQFSAMNRIIAPIFARNFAYKSAISLDNLYPNSSLRLYSPSKPSTSMSDKFSGYIPLNELDISYSRSSGPGGQNVNKVNTKVTVRIHLQSANWLDPEVKTKLAETHKTRISKEGFLIFRSDVTRSQQLNLADCLNKIRNCVLEASYKSSPPSVETLEKIRNRKESAARERLIQKRMHSETKANRQAPIIL